MQFALIIALSVASCVVYGIVHDQVTARICLEYFTVGHPPLLETTSPTLLGLAWGVAATWWVGAILGGPLAIASRAGSWPKRTAASLVRPIGVLMLICGACAALAGGIGFYLARTGRIRLVDWLASRIPPDHHAAFLADWWAHGASYLVGFVGGVVLVVVVAVQRRRAARASDPASGRTAQAGDV